VIDGVAGSAFTVTIMMGLVPEIQPETLVELTV
jgi:hypothetical protein